MNFYVSKSGNEWKVKQTEIDTDVWRVKYLPISDTYYVIVEMVPGSRHIHTLYGQALFEGMRAIERLASPEWKRDFGQI